MHMHNLMLGPFVGGYENSCEGCMLPITDPFYYCTECVFFLHKACAELPKMKNVWRHRCREPLALISYKGIRCEQCRQISNTFAYECSECEGQICLRCVIALTPGARTCLKHEHPLFFYRDYKGQCNACGFTTRWAVIQKIITVISVKKVDAQIVGFIIVQNAILLLMLVVFLENIHSSNSGASMKKQVIHTHSPL
ncbi:uncharacterized protein LOC105796394 [Gossypium raimondii]|uniref:uncharacterized protein LOC105796394 n=1 Tax=Gossypium raimondii TaxID=29730 RepID=UPI00227AE623|nr:uncharacterized protein LOC105796394 [Gossypium raimondii]